MWVLIIVLMFEGNFSIQSNQVMYPTGDMCETDRVLIQERFNKTKPKPSAIALTKCVDMPFEGIKYKL